MAGDIDRRERLIVLGESVPLGADRASAAARTAGTATIHQYGQRVLIADVPQELDERVEHEVALAPAPGHLMASADELTAEAAEGLDEVESLGLAAFTLRSSDDYLSAKAARPHEGEPWGQPDADVLPPDASGDDEELRALAGTPGSEASSATSGRLMGSVAVGVILVEGPTAALQFTAAERVKVVAEVQNGLAWLGAQSSPAGIRWVYDVQTIRISARPSSNDDTLAKKEARFRDPALTAMGFGTGLAGAQAYVNSLRNSRRTDWAYCAFFTKYPVGHFAYASLGGPRLVMHYDNDGWGPDNIDRVFAHETGHIFQAPDEYASSGCSCGGQWGHFKVANGNCESCASGGGVACIMKSNSWAMCTFTPYHLGFPQGARYSGVFVSGTGSHGLWANASWTPFVQKWQQWSSQGLRLVDLDVAQIGAQYRFTGAFRAGSGPYGLWAMADWSSFVSRWQQWSAQGMRLVDLEVTPVGSQVRYSGVFRQGSGAYGLWALADWPSFQAKWQQWSGQGLRLTDLAIVMVGGHPRYSGVFEQGAGGHALWVLADWPSFEAKWQQWSAQGLRLVDLERTRVGNQTRFSGVFRQGTGGYGLWTGASWTSFRERWEQWNAQGLRLVDVSMDPTGTEAVAAQEAGSPDTGAPSGLEGLLGFGGEQIRVGPTPDGDAPGEGLLQMEVAPVDTEAGVGVGAAFPDGAAAAGSGQLAPSGHGEVVGALLDSPGAAGIGGSSLPGTPSLTAPSPGMGEAVLGDADSDAAVPPLVGSGMVHNG
jgi:hypothetical protein